MMNATLSRRANCRKWQAESNVEYLSGLFLLPVLVTLYYLVFVRSVIPLEMGWFQDIAIRMDSGQVIYRDFYWYAPPYYPWFCWATYKMFGIHFFLYTIFGFVVNRIGQTVLAYVMLCKYLKPRYVFIPILLGVALNSAYQMDLVFDANPFITTLMMLQALFVQKLVSSTEDVVRHRQSLFVGLISGIQIMMKQTGLALLVASLVITVVSTVLQRKKVTKVVLLQCLGTAVAVIPGLIYLIVNDAFLPMLDCIVKALGAKAGLSGSAANVLSMIKPTDLLICAGILIVCLVKKGGAQSDEEQGNKMPAITIFKLCISFCVAGLAVVRLSNFPLPMIERYMELPILTRTCILLAMLVVCGALVLSTIKLNEKGSGTGLLVLSATVMAICICAVIMMPHNIKEAIVKYLSFYDLKQMSLYVSVYLLFAFWIYHLVVVVRFFSYSEETGLLKFFVAESMVVAYMISSVMSATIEELYMIPVVSIVGSLTVNLIAINIPGGICVYVAYAYIVILLCLCQKVLAPYSWHTWQTTSIDYTNDPVRAVNIPGLEGFLLADSEATQYESMYKTINDYVEDDEELYQFCNVPLMNVLTGHVTQRYVPVTYFDVCPDDLAVEVAQSLYIDYPDAIYWGSFNEARWEIHERLFRAGAASGQRKIQEFYNQIVINEYINIGHYECNAQDGSYIDLWVKPVASTGEPTENYIYFDEEIAQPLFITESSCISELGIWLATEDDEITQLNICIIGEQGETVAASQLSNVELNPNGYTRIPLEAYLSQGCTYRVIIDVSDDEGAAYNLSKNAAGNAGGCALYVI